MQELQSEGHLWCLSRKDLNISFITAFILFAVQSLFFIQDWSSLVEVGSQFCFLTNYIITNPSASVLLRFIIFAQAKITQESNDFAQIKRNEKQQLIDEFETAKVNLTRYEEERGK
jgi:hypothetical protein